MRTTVTLDPDVQALVARTMAERQVSFKDAVNGLLRSALVPNGTRDRQPFATFAMGPPAVALDGALRLADALEDDEIVRKMSVGR